MKARFINRKDHVAKSGSTRFTNRVYLTLGAVIAVAAILRILYLGRESLWFDEAISFAIARLNWPDFWKVVSHLEANMALYYALLHLWLHLGTSEFVLRSFSALAGVLAVPLLYALGKQMFDAKVGLIAAGLLALNPFHIRYSQEARGYALEVLLVVLSSLLFFRCLEQGSRKAWIEYVLASTLAVYVHFFAALVLAAQWFSLVSVDVRSRPWKRLLISISAIMVLLLPLAVFVVARDTGQLAWVSKPGVADIYGLFDALAGGGRPLVLAYLVPCFAAIVVAVKTWSRLGNSRETWHYGLLLSWLLVPVLTAFTVSLRKPIFVDRFLIGCLPPLVLLVAVGLSQIPNRWILGGSLVVLAMLSARRISRYDVMQQKEDWRAATSYVTSHASRGDAVLFYTSYGRLGFDYYTRRMMPTSRIFKVVFPESLDLDAVEKADPTDSLLASLPKQYEQVWLFLRFSEESPILQERDRAIEAILSNEYPEEKQMSFHGVRILEYSSNGYVQRAGRQ